jgi:hypothetical protein
VVAATQQHLDLNVHLTKQGSLKLTKEYRKDDKAPSDMFVNCLSEGGVGSDSLECGWCSRQHYCPDTDYIHYGDADCTAEESMANYRKYCEEEQRKDPNGVVLHYDCDSISGQELNGINFVIGCPCNGLTRYENFIWGNKDTIRKYLKTRIDFEYELAQQQLTINKLMGV